MIPCCDLRALNMVLVILAVTCIAGCGSAPLPVQGSVNFKGKPVIKGSITFIATEGQMGDHGTVSEEIQAGEYSFDVNRGLKPGNYKVEIYGSLKEDKVAGDPDMQSSSSSTSTTEAAIPPKYNKKTELTAEVHSGSGPIDFDLTP